MSTVMEIAGRAVKAGTKQFIGIPVTRDLGDMDIKLWVHAYAGARPGPTVAFLSLLHGSEWFSFQVVRQFEERLDPGEMCGNVLVVPVGNPVALNAMKRNTPDESDSPDVNRSFGGTFTWIADLLAQAIAREVLEKSDCLIDLHVGPWGTALGASSYGDDFAPEVVAKSDALALAWGYPCIERGPVLSSFTGPKSSFGFAGKTLGLPNIGPEIGGLGFGPRQEAEWLGENVRGCLNVCKYLGILQGEPELPERYLYWRKRWRVNPSTSGLLLPEKNPEKLLREVKKGELLGKVLDEGSFEVLEELRAPGDGFLFTIAREYPVRPGYWAFGVIDGKDAATSWVNRDQARRVLAETAKGWPKKDFVEL